ncbi:hypothetical protein NEOLEDRAFT_1177952 [Neolentinus lepideus HHB14362 ss-1]|uniref:Uncharacterized protein n=1 Tax=Neolentinus lepideus HHB14362 ss-1 TaxID=1314782 RepID=A0A165T5F6_9AGAM|nr:hypothetical protein NEOLEDRAFT_1177952 [Neolentinus lepideus HHB14362 ss-1]
MVSLYDTCGRSTGFDKASTFSIEDPSISPSPLVLSESALVTCYKFFLRYTEGGAFQPLVNCILNTVHESSPLFIKPITGSVPSQLKSRWLEKAYINHFGFNWESLEKLGVLDSKYYPKLMGYWNRLKEREAYKKAHDGFKAALWGTYYDTFGP